MPVFAQSVGYNPLPQVAVSGQPAYFYGSIASDTQDTLMQVTKVALASNVATLTVYMRQGSIPAVGRLVTVQGTTQASGAFNVSRVALTGVTIAADGTGTITFALTHADVTAVADSGAAIVPVQEVPETLAANTSQVIYVPSQEPKDLGARSITVAVTFPTIQATTGAGTVKLYTAITNDGSKPGDTGSEWTLMGTTGVVGTLAAGAATVSGLTTFTSPAGRFFCLQTTSVTGTNTIIAKVLS
jgi:hypothetical protein